MRDFLSDETFPFHSQTHEHKDKAGQKHRPADPPSYSLKDDF